MQLIDKTAAYNAMKHEAETHGLPFSAEAYDRAARIIDQMPTIEAEPVRHGRWIECSNELDKKCSCCDKVHGTIYEKEPYCPNCGSQMDGGADND